VHRWLNFIAGFSPEFVNGVVEDAGIRDGGRLLDPFCGMATSLVAANHLGLDAIGFEPHPFFFDVATAKVATRRASEIDEVESILDAVVPLVDSSDVWGPDARKFLDKLVEPPALSWLAGALLSEQHCSEPVRPLYRLVVTRVLEGAAGGKTDGIYKAPTTAKRSIDVHEMAARVIEHVRGDLQTLPGQLGESVVYNRSAEDMSAVAPGSIDLCVTSPPYLNNFDFAEMTRMELYYWRYAQSWAEITANVRSRLVINTTTAPTVERRRQDHWESLVPVDLASDLHQLRTDLRAERAARPGKKEYDTLVFPYFAQMSTVLHEVSAALKPSAPLHMVVSDAALYGVHIHTEKYLARIMEAQGLAVKEIVRLRNRGGRWVLAKRQGSAEGLGEFHIHAVKES